MENMQKDVKLEPKKEEAEKTLKNHLERLKEINIGGYAEVK